MTVAELIAQLQRFPPDAEVVVYENSGTRQVFEVEAVGEPHEGVRRDVVEPEVVVYVS